MIAAPHHHGLARGSERWISGVAVALVHLALAYALIAGLAVRLADPAKLTTRVVEITLTPPPPIKPRPTAPHQASPTRTAPAPREHAGGSAGPSRRPVQSTAAPLAAIAGSPAPGGVAGHGALVGPGSGGGSSGGAGAGGDGDGGGSDLELLSGSIEPSDYPRAALRAGIGGRVAVRFIVGVSGRVTACTITRSSGNADLDAATCRVIAQRFRYRPSTDAAGRPVADEVDGEHVWLTDARDRPE